MFSALSQQVNWSFLFLPVSNMSAEGNNDSGVTSYLINISAQSDGVDVYIRATDDLKTVALDILIIGNETYSYNKSNSSVPSLNKFSLSTDSSDNKIGDNLQDGDVIFLKFFLNAPSGQAACLYNNSLEFKAVSHGQSV